LLSKRILFILISSDIIVFDWDVGAPEILSEESLKNILEGTYCLDK
jgi:hypothetical protein